MIMRTACRLFAEKGFRGTTTRELASAAGITEPVLYEHFKTKSDLYSAIIEASAAEGIAVLSGLNAKYENAQDDYGFFTELAWAVVDWFSEDTDFHRLLLFSSLEGHDLKQRFHERSKECFEIITSYIARRQAEGAIRSDCDPHVAAGSFFGMVAHYCTNAIVFDSCPLKGEPKQIVRAMVEIYLGGLCTKGKQ